MSNSHCRLAPSGILPRHHNADWDINDTSIPRVRTYPDYMDRIKTVNVDLMYNGPCIIVIVEE